MQMQRERRSEEERYYYVHRLRASHVNRFWGWLESVYHFRYYDYYNYDDSMLKFSPFGTNKQTNHSRGGSSVDKQKKKKRNDRLLIK